MNETILKIFESIESGTSNIPPTILYNEGWLLRLILYWFSKNKNTDSKLTFLDNSVWFSEVLLSSPFLPRYRGDNLAESYTHADGVIGHFEIGDSGYGDLKLKHNCEQFIILEAKMFSGLSEKTAHAPRYNQAARTVACMSHIISKNRINLDQINHLGFIIIAPSNQFDIDGKFQRFTDQQHIIKQVEARIAAYKERSDYQKIDIWYKESLIRFINKVDINLLSWEKILETISIYDSEYHKRMDLFYRNCLKYNNKNTSNKNSAI